MPGGGARPCRGRRHPPRQQALTPRVLRVRRLGQPCPEGSTRRPQARAALGTRRSQPHRTMSQTRPWTSQRGAGAGTAPFSLPASQAHSAPQLPTLPVRSHPREQSHLPSLEPRDSATAPRGPESQRRRRPRLPRTPHILSQSSPQACPLQMEREMRPEGGQNCSPALKGLMETATQSSAEPRYSGWRGTSWMSQTPRTVRRA